MKMRIVVSVQFNAEQKAALVRGSKTCGFDYDSTENQDVLIRRFLEAEVRDAVTYAEERYPAEPAEPVEGDES